MLGPCDLGCSIDVFRWLQIKALFLLYIVVIARLTQRVFVTSPHVKHRALDVVLIYS